MAGSLPDRTGIILTLFIYMDGLTGILTQQRSVLSVHSHTTGTISSRENEVQSSLDRFYSDSELVHPDIRSVELIFVNSIFHRSGSGQLETYKNRLPAYLLFHREFFKVPLTYEHVAQRLQRNLADSHQADPRPVMWFHLRKHILYVLFSTVSGEISVNSFEVHKTLDVYYYILFNYQTLQPLLPDLEHIVISGDLVDMEKIHNFFEENMPDKRLQNYWQWKKLPGKPPIRLNPFLPEVNIGS